MEVDDTASLETLAFDIATIRTATNDFSSENCVGDSEHGVVYKVWEEIPGFLLLILKSIE